MWSSRVDEAPHLLHAVRSLTTKLSFPAQELRCEVLNLATGLNAMIISPAFQRIFGQHVRQRG